MAGSSPRHAEEVLFEAEFEHRLESVIATAEWSDPVRPYLYRTTIAFALFDPSADRVWCDERFEDWVNEDAIEPQALQAASSGEPSATRLVKDTAQRPILLIYVPGDKATGWAAFEPRLGSELTTPGRVAVAALSLGHMADEIEHAGRALGLSNLEARVAGALFAHGSIKRAGVHAGVTYHTARKALARAMKAAGVSRQPSLIRKLSELATVTSPPREATVNVLVDIFNLSRRDASLVHYLCEGYSRSDAAKLAGVSDAVAKDRFAHIFEALEIESATDLPPLVMSAFGAAVLRADTTAIVRPARRERAPLALLRSPDGRAIAVSDYGPAGADPVLIVHSSLSTRHPFSKVVEALRKKGFRPLTIDRPGFGLTDGAPEKPDRFSVGTGDVECVCNQLGLERVKVLTRGGAFHALALARELPERIAKVVAINPDLLQQDCSRRKGHLGVVRMAFDRYPDSVAKVASWTAAALSKKRIETVIKLGIGDAPADLRCFADPRNFEDYARSIMAFSTGQLSGFVREQRGYVLQTSVEGVSDASNWTILLGGSDPIHDTDEIRNFWSRKLPGAQVQTIADAGRFISLSHTQLVIDALKG